MATPKSRFQVLHPHWLAARLRHFWSRWFPRICGKFARKFAALPPPTRPPPPPPPPLAGSSTPPPRLGSPFWSFAGFSEFAANSREFAGNFGASPPHRLQGRPPLLPPFWSPALFQRICGKFANLHADSPVSRCEFAANSLGKRICGKFQPSHPPSTHPTPTPSSTPVGWRPG